MMCLVAIDLVDGRLVAHCPQLVRANVREFERVPGLLVTDWAA
jgi:hypothetical protein